MDNEILIIGGGLAGLTAAIHLSKVGFSVVVIEKNQYPRHKVCGEYISNEVSPYLNWLGITVSSLQPSTISKLQFSNSDGKTITIELPLGGFGISRYKLDEYLYQKALDSGCRFFFENVESVAFDSGTFTVITSLSQILKSKIVIGAFGKRSNLDVKMQRGFIREKSPWLGIKAHYSGDFEDDVVGLHNFNGGYCGISKVENGILNVCYLSDYKTFQRFKNIDHYQQEVLCQNPNLKSFFETAQMLFEKPVSIGQISFEDKNAVEDHVLMIGDSAGMIHPLCGNGMAMAIHSAKIVSESIQKFKLENRTRKQLESEYEKQWNLHFRKRIQMGRILAGIFQKPKTTRILLRIFVRMPVLLKYVVKYTHGKPIAI